MFSGLPSFLSHDLAWLIIVPKRVEFSQPSFHFGERVKFCQGQGKDRSWETGRIIGIKFSQQETWMALNGFQGSGIGGLVKGL